MKQSLNPVVVVVVIVIVVAIAALVVWKFGSPSKEEMKEPNVPTAVTDDPIGKGTAPTEGTGDPSKPAGPLMGGGGGG